MILIHSQGWEPGIYKSYQKKIRETFSVLPSLSPAQSPAPQVSTGTFPEGALPIQDSPVVLQPKKHLSLPHFFTFYCLSTASFLSNLQFLGPVHNKHFLWQTVSSNSTKCSPPPPHPNLVKGERTQREGETKPWIWVWSIASFSGELFTINDPRNHPIPLSHFTGEKMETQKGQWTSWGHRAGCSITV